MEMLSRRETLVKHYTNHGFEEIPIKCCYYEVMKPVFWGLRLLFKFPYHISPQGEFRVHYLSFWMFYSVAMYIGLFYPVILCIMEVYDQYKSASTKDTLLMALSISSFMAFHVQSPGAFLIEAKNIAGHINSWKELEEEYWRMTGEELQPALGGWVRTFVILLFPSIIIFFSVEQTVFSDLMDIKLIVIVTTYLSAALYLCFFVFTCNYACHVAKSLKKHLKKTLLSGISGVRTEALANLRVLWVKLSNLTQEIGEAIGRTLMLKIGVYILFTIITSYNILMNIVSWGDIWSPTPFFILSFLYIHVVSLLNLYFLSASAHQATDEVGLSFAFDLFTVDMSNMDYETKFNIIEFINTVYLNGPRITIGGFFTINRQLFMSYLGNTVTYIIALSQFKNTEKKP